MSQSEPLNLLQYEEAARKVLPQAAFDYYAGGAEDEITLRENRTAYDRWRFKPRVLTGVGQRDLATTALGTPLSFPVAIAPTAYQRMAAPEGELATARAAGAAGTIMCVSSLATCTLEEVAQAASGPLWYQLYCFKDRAITSDLVARAKAAGYKALALTVDTPVLGRRERDIRNSFTLPPGLSMKNFEKYARGAMPQEIEGTSGLAAYFASQINANLTWDDLSWLASIAGMPVVVKGVMCAEDTRLCAEHGAAGVIVSNHGGRQLDGALATLDALPEVAEAAAGTGLEVFVDGGVRRGTDALKALALGARAVFIGRPVLWGLAVNGEAGVRRVLELLQAEFDLALALAGVRRAVDVKRELVVHA